MKVISVIALTFAVVFACGKTKVEVEDSEHAISIGADLCEIFDDTKEKQDCVRRLLNALEKQCEEPEP